MYFTHLACASRCGAGLFDPRERHFVCPGCSLPLLAQYDLQAARGWKRDSLQGREPNMWRYRELMPLLPGDEPVTLGEGFTPLIHARRLGATLGLDRLFIKDESLNPGHAFAASGQAAAIRGGEGVGAPTIALAPGRNAGNGGAGDSAAPGAAGKVFIPPAGKQPFVDECRLYGADVTLV